MKKIKVISRYWRRNGDYISTITEGKIVSVFENSKVAKSTAIAMQNSNIKINFDGNYTIIQKMNGSEEEIFNKVKGELDSAIMNKKIGQKINYEILEE